MRLIIKIIIAKIAIIILFLTMAFLFLIKPFVKSWRKERNVEDEIHK